MSRRGARTGERDGASEGPGPAEVAAWIANDDRFRVLSADGLHWIDPHTGTLVDAAFGWEEAARDWLLAQRPWTRQAPHSLRDIIRLKWRHHLRDHLVDEPRLRRFDSRGRWLNPYTGRWVPGIRRAGDTITKDTIADLAAVLADCPEATSGSMLGETELERIVLTAEDHHRASSTPVAKGYSAPATSGNRLRIRKRRRTTEGDGTRIPGYEVIETIGSGGMSTVYRARQTTMDRDVALKVLRPMGERADAFAERFMREARAAGRIDHTHVVRVFDVGRESGLLYMSMELMAGGDSEAAMSKSGRPFPEREALAVIRAAACGLAELHRHGIVHRDIKPSNIFLDREGGAKIGDLGMAKHDGIDNTVTVEGAAVGTPAFMAPEQARARGDMDHRVDIYALGASLYSLLAGRPPFTGPNVFSIVRQVVSDDFPDVRRRNRAVGDATLAIIERATAHRPEDRYADCAELIAAIDEALAADPQTAADPTGDEIETVSIEADGTARIRRHRHPSSSGSQALAAEDDPRAALRRLGWRVASHSLAHDDTEDLVFFDSSEGLVAILLGSDVPASIPAITHALEASLGDLLASPGMTAADLVEQVRRHGPEAAMTVAVFAPGRCSLAVHAGPHPLLISEHQGLQLRELDAADGQRDDLLAAGTRVVCGSPGLHALHDPRGIPFDARQLAMAALASLSATAEGLARAVVEAATGHVDGPITTDAWALVIEPVPPA